MLKHHQVSIGHPDVLQIHLSRDDSFEETSTPKEKLNSLLASRGVSPIRYTMVYLGRNPPKEQNSFI